MNMSERKVANALGGKTARACDSCLRKRARWFCTADDAFLCQACDASVHSANQLASRHERVRLETSSFKGSHDLKSSSPTWHHGFTRKARTPRRNKSMKLQTQTLNHPLPFVPEINGEDPFSKENEGDFLYRVPIFDCHDLNLDEFLTCDFAEDVGSLLGTGSKEDYDRGIDDLRMGIVDCEDEDELVGGKKLKVEGNEDDDEVQAVIASQFNPELDMELNWDFDYASSMSIDEDMKIVAANEATQSIGSESEPQIERKMLRLDHEAVIAAWASQGSPWTNGIRPQINLDDLMVECLRGGGRRSGVDDAGRQARVSRYREKRRTRLFAKKIRYEVRKLNAEKRPRIKGRFVKRTSLSVSSLPLPYLMNK